MHLPLFPSCAAAAEQRVPVRGASAPHCAALCQTTAFQKLSGLKLHRSYGSAGLTVTFCHSCQCRSTRDERNGGCVERSLQCFEPLPLLGCLGGEGAFLLLSIGRFQNTCKFNLFSVTPVTLSQYFPKCLLSLIASNIFDAATKVLVGWLVFCYLL